MHAGRQAGAMLPRNYNCQLKSEQRERKLCVYFLTRQVKEGYFFLKCDQSGGSDGTDTAGYWVFFPTSHLYFFFLLSEPSVGVSCPGFLFHIPDT